MRPVTHTTRLTKAAMWRYRRSSTGADSASLLPRRLARTKHTAAAPASATMNGTAVTGVRGILRHAAGHGRAGGGGGLSTGWRLQVLASGLGVGSAMRVSVLWSVWWKGSSR